MVITFCFVRLNDRDRRESHLTIQTCTTPPPPFALFYSLHPLLALSMQVSFSSKNMYRKSCIPSNIFFLVIVISEYDYNSFLFYFERNKLSLTCTNKFNCLNHGNFLFLFTVVVRNEKCLVHVQHIVCVCMCIVIMYMGEHVH